MNAPTGRTTESRHFALALLGVWLTVLAFSVALVLGLAKARQGMEAKADERGQSLARLVASYTESVFERVDEKEQDIIRQLDAGIFRRAKELTARERQSIEALLIEHQQRYPKIVSLSLTDATGEVFANSVGTPPGASLADRDYFLALKNGASGPVISPALQGRVSKKWGVQVARRIASRDGRFLGMLVANLGLDETFVSFFRSVEAGEGSLLALHDSNNVLLVRYPIIESGLGKPLPPNSAGEQILSGIDEIVVSSRSGLDQQLRTMFLKRLEHYPIYATAGISAEDALADYSRERFWVGLFILFSWIAGAAVSELLRRQKSLLAQLNQAHGQLEERNDELKVALAQAEILATHDKLTGVLNRRAFDQQFDSVIARVARAGGTFSVILIDLDHFKRVNDTYGHAVGDSVLRELVGILSGRLRFNDSLARWGGEEFVIIAENADRQQAELLAEDLRQSVAEQPFTTAQHLTISIGLAEYRPGESADALMIRVDRALYRAKTDGRNRVVAHAPEAEASCPV